MALHLTIAGGRALRALPLALAAECLYVGQTLQREPPLTDDHQLLARAGVSIDRGLAESELAVAEAFLGTPLPPDLRAFLAAGLPSGPSYPNWRRLGSQLQEFLDLPADGICFDVQHNAFWWPAWGHRPENLDRALAIAREALAAAPRLVPVCGHRYLPALPSVAGNPVLSVHQTDIIYYGHSLAEYLRLEHGGLTYSQSTYTTPRRIPFWSELIDPQPEA